MDMGIWRCLQNDKPRLSLHLLLYDRKRNTKMRHDDDTRENQKAQNYDMTQPAKEKKGDDEQTLQSSTTQEVIAKELFAIASSSVSEIMKVSGILSQKGLCEVVMFNSSIILNDMTFKGKPYYDAVSGNYLGMLLALIETQRRDLDENELMTFINKRIKSYSDEYDKLTTDGQYVPIWVYSTFYLAPLEGKVKPNIDILQVMSFQIGLIRMATKVHDLLVEKASMDFKKKP